MRLLILLLLLASGFVSAEQTPQWLQALRDGQAVLIMRHAQAPGVGDPERFRLGDCSTQRNLDQRGREQAVYWGDYLREQGIVSVRLYTSGWCRAQETAEGLNLGPAQVLDSLNSFFGRPALADQSIRELRAFVSELGPGAPVIMVSHQVNITALTGEFPRSGEALILAVPLGDKVEVLARVPVPEP
ncbi:MAG: histidine phosphatase family protein [Pseudomonas sp.]